MYNQVRKTVKQLIKNIRYPKRILVVRQSDHQSTYNDYFLYWLSQNFPEAANLFEVHYLPGCKITNWEKYGLFLPWLQDPLKERFPHIYQEAKQLEAKCLSHKIPIINPVDTHSNSIKSVAAKIISSVGIRTAQTVKIADIEDFKKTLGGLETPFLIREDWVHGSKSYLIQNRDELDRVPFDEFIAPIGVEFIDTKDEDGLYRKYRYFAIADVGIPGPLMLSHAWEVRNNQRVLAEKQMAEEIAYFSGEDPNHQKLQLARKALGFDYMAFDYSYDREGNIVVWEPNPFAVIWSSRKPYQMPSINRIYTALLKFYLERANISINTAAAYGK